MILTITVCYSYYAISMKDGSIVRGTEPEFEECVTAEDSFEDFMGKMVNGECDRLYKIIAKLRWLMWKIMLQYISR